MNLRDCVLGAAVAASLVAGAEAGTAARPNAPMLIGAAFLEHGAWAMGRSAWRGCVGPLLDIAGELAALAKRI